MKPLVFGAVLMMVLSSPAAAERLLERVARAEQPAVCLLKFCEQPLRGGVIGLLQRPGGVAASVRLSVRPRCSASASTVTSTGTFIVDQACADLQ